MNFETLSLSGVALIRLPKSEDSRGDFVKIFHDVDYAASGYSFHCKESYLTKSRYGVLRGMHFQVPPHAYAKIIRVVSGKILDVVLDLRKSSPTFGKALSFELDANVPTCLFIPVGFAHGFLALQDASQVLYFQSAGYAPQSDHMEFAGILSAFNGQNWTKNTSFHPEMRISRYGQISIPLLREVAYIFLSTKS